jgi:hypothetical protein
VFGIFSLASVVGIATTASVWTVVWAGVFGFSAAGVLVLALAVPPMLCAPQDVAPVTAAVLTVSYSLAMIVAVASGAAWDVTGVPVMAFVPMGLCALILFALPSTLPFGRTP